ncbi:hypothetical protein CALVIDRAFT_299818 [Calocera viscosa TUFC12733]|uniref:Uncharacterized protein n=1 Tax=Calocera viscosa (strain TUFC12733) TaxID=1330018 RepID=A0A167IH87_CALVF|nr:hypothetical protein CALVIDRAFT_299818 [Calocera viscosa TUFC12733]
MCRSIRTSACWHPPISWSGIMVLRSRSNLGVCDLYYRRCLAKLTMESAMARDDQSWDSAKGQTFTSLETRCPIGSWLGLTTNARRPRDAIGIPIGCTVCEGGLHKSAMSPVDLVISRKEARAPSSHTGLLLRFVESRYFIAWLRNTTAVRVL